jgi:hypothetical protein
LAVLAAPAPIPAAQAMPAAGFAAAPLHAAKAGAAPAA